MSNRITSISIGLGIVCLIGVALYQRASVENIQAFIESRSAYAEGVTRIESSLTVVTDVISEIAENLASIESIKTTIAEQEERLSELEGQIDPELERKKLEAMALAADIVEKNRLEKYSSAQHFIQKRLDSRESEITITQYRTEAQYGSLLQELGIEGERYEGILSELSRLKVENEDNLAAYRGGVLSADEFQSLFSQNSADLALQSFLSEEEYGNFQALKSKSDSQNAEKAIYIRMLQLTPNMSVSTREVLAATYSRVRETLPPDYYSEETPGSALERKYSYMVYEALPALAEMYEASLEGIELEEARRFLQAADIENRKYLELINAGVIK